jgi:hypothetical protein
LGIAQFYIGIVKLLDLCRRGAAFQELGVRNGRTEIVHDGLKGAPPCIILRNGGRREVERAQTGRIEEDHLIYLLGKYLSFSRSENAETRIPLQKLGHGMNWRPFERELLG